MIDPGGEGPSKGAATGTDEGAATEGLPTPGEQLRRYGLSPRKPWGQNFLHDPRVLDAIVGAAEAGPQRRIVEIGAGLGTLTQRLLASGADVWAIERDRDLCAVLRSELGDDPRLRIIEANAVTFDYASAAVGRAEPATIVGNLPYHLTGPLLFALLEHHEQTGPWVIMVQREVADRLRAAPGSRRYGGPTVVLSRVREIELVRMVPRGAFLPPPRVDSAVLRLLPLQAPRGDVGDRHRFAELVRSVFQRRRKTIVNALTGLASRPAASRWCQRAGIDPSVRPEQLGPEQFAALQRARDVDDAGAA